MRIPYPLVFVSSFSVLSFEILLIRIFTIRLSYHYASLIISLSMAGLVVGSLLVFFKQRSIHFRNISPSLCLQHIAASLVISYPVIFILLSVIPLDHIRMLWESTQIVYLALFILLCTIPFFLYGLFISLALSLWHEKTNIVYASDLAGGAAGLLAVFILMDVFAIEYILVIVTVAASSVILYTLEKTASRVALGLTIIVPCLFVGSGISQFEISPYKGLAQALKDDDAQHVTTFYSAHSRLDLFENPRMKLAPGLSLTFTDAVPRGMGMSLDGEIVGVFMDDKNIKSYDFLAYMPSSLPYLIARPRDVVVIGAKNSIDLMQAGYFGARNIYATEHDSSVLKAFAAQYGGHGLSSIPVFNGSGRNLLQNLHKRVGLIAVSRTGLFPSGSFGLQEDYDLTVEAIKTYLESLNDDGMVFVQMFLLPPPRLELRLAKNINIALSTMDVQERSHLLIYRSWDTVNFLIKRNGFSEADLEKARRFLAGRQFDLLYPDAPGQEKFITGLDYSGLFSKVLGSEVTVDFESSYPFDIRETTDDRPFFHYFLRFAKMGEIFEISGRKWAYFLHEGMFLPFVLIFLSVFALCILCAVILISRLSGHKAERLKLNAGAPMLAYFSLIGFAFMFLEVFFIHRLILPLGSPVMAFSLTVVAILFSAGLGSLASGRVISMKSIWIMGFAPFLIVMCYLLFDLFDEKPASGIIIIPIGVALGFFFPVGIRHLTEEKTGSVPLAYAANGAASVIAPSFASLVAVAFGCRILLILAAILYSLAIAILLHNVLAKSKALKMSANIVQDSTIS